MPTATESDLIRQAQAGDMDAMAALLERHQGRLMRFAIKLCGPQDAPGVVQDAMLDAIRGIEDFRGEAALSTWLYALARSRCLKRRRGAVMKLKSAEPLEEQTDLATQDVSPDEDTLRHELRETLNRAIDALDDEHREVLVLRDVEGVSGKETADLLGISLAAMKSRLHRARKTLRDQVAPVLGDPQPFASCPDVADMFSKHLEGDIAPMDCDRMERHLESCERCQKVCDSLKDVLSACRAIPEPRVPDGLQREIRTQIRARMEKD